MTLDGAGLRVLTRAECVSRLTAVTVGRVALSWRAMPMILPVHFVVTDDDTIVFHARPGTTLHGATEDAVVAFEAEGPAGALEPLWSVVVHGVATHPHPTWPAPSGPPRPEPVELAMSEVSGREVLDLSDPMAPMMVAALPRW